MRLKSPFIKLPLSFDAKRLAKEALQFSEADWTYHPLRHKGNAALPLVSVDGKVNDLFSGEMRPTLALRECPYVRQIMATFQTVVGRSRFMRLASGADVPSHSDGNYTWRKRVRIHIPIITHPDVTFSSVGNIDVHMASGEAWVFDNWREHAVYNRSPLDRIHLVIDTVGTAKFWQTVKAGWDVQGSDADWNNSVRFIPFDQATGDPELHFEKFNTVPVRPPDEIDNMLNELLEDLGRLKRDSPDLFNQARLEIETFQQDWRGYWAIYSDSVSSIPHYELLAKRLKARLEPLLRGATFDSNQANAYEVAAAWVSSATDSTIDTSADIATVEPLGDSKDVADPTTSAATGITLEEYIREFNVPAFERPIFIVATPRSGSTMLFEALQKNKDIWTIGDESQREIELIPALHPKTRGFDSNILSADDYTAHIGALLMDAFMSRLKNAAGSGYLQTPDEYRPASVRFLEKTPKNSLRIPFFRTMFPDAKFIFLHRQAAPNIGSMIDAWQSEKFVTYKELPDWDGPRWSLLLPPGWRSMKGRSLAEIAAWQWAQTNERIMVDLSRLSDDDWVRVSYESLLEKPAETLQALCTFAGIPYGPRMQSIARDGFAISRYTLTAPNENKWKRHEKDIKAASSLYSEVEERVSNFN